MSEHLDKARAALGEARETDDASRKYLILIEIARVQAEIAQAAALERIADVLESVHNTEDGLLRTEVI